MLKKLRSIELSHGDMVLFVVIGICLLPIWLVPFFPTQDGASHVENAELILNYWNLQRPEVREFYLLNTGSLTNWLGHNLLTGLLVAFPPLTAEKVFLSAYVILMPLGAWYLLRAHSKEAGWFALLVVPFVFSVVLYKGFYNFCTGMVIYFFMLGFFWRRRKGLSRRGTLALAVLSLLLYAAHVIAWAMGALALVILAGWFLLRDWEGGETKRAAMLRGIWMPVAVALVSPATLLFLFVRQDTGTPFAFETDWWTELWNLVRLNVMVALDERDFWFGGVLAAGLGLLLVVQLVNKMRTRMWNAWDGWLVVTAAYLGVYLIAPGALAGGSFVKQRLMLFLCFAVIVWLGAQAYPNRWRVAIQAAAVVWIVGLLVVRWDATRALSAQLADVYATGAMVAPGSTFLPLTIASRAPDDPTSPQLSRIRVLLHAAGYAAAERHAVNLGNYEARTDYFPLMYRPERSPIPFFRGLASGTPSLDLDGYENATDVRVEYVLLLAEDASFGDEFAVPKDILQELEPRYEMVMRSPMGHALLYRREADQ